MNKAYWMFATALFAGERYGWWQAALGVLAVEAVGSYLTGFFGAWWADRISQIGK